MTKVVKIKSIQKRSDVLDRYDLTVPTTGNFFANNVLIHNTSVILSNIPVRRKLSWWEKVKLNLGFNVPETEFGHIYSTRRVIQNQYINPKAYRANNEPNNEYMAVQRDFAEYLAPGMTVYGEIVGFKPSGQPIQSPKGITHDYGCDPHEYKFMPYRITETTGPDEVTEWSIEDVMRWVNTVREKMPSNIRHRLMDLQLLYHGFAGDQYGLYEKIAASTSIEEYNAELVAFKQSPEYAGWIPKNLESYEEYIKNKWRVAWIEAMRADKDGLGMELQEPLCRNPKAPREGIVVRIDGDSEARAWKLKTKAHFELSQKATDAGEADPEDLA